MTQAMFRSTLPRKLYRWCGRFYKLDKSVGNWTLPLICRIAKNLFFSFSKKIHTRLWYCGSTVTCNCGVAIREKKDVIVLTTCTQDLQLTYGMPMKVLITSQRQLTRGTKIFARHPGSYSVYEVRNQERHFFFLKPSHKTVPISKTISKPTAKFLNK